MKKYFKKFIRKFHDIVYKEWFIDLFFPVGATALISIVVFAILHKACERCLISGWVELFISIFTGLFFGIIIFYIQQRFYHYAFTDTLKEFISITKSNHPVTQKFASKLLSNCLVGDHTIAELFSRNKKTLKGLAYDLENDTGVIMEKSIYAAILTKSIEFLPNEVKATWDTQHVPLTDAPELYHTYLAELDQVYSLIPDKGKKQRVFIFKDEYSFRIRNTTKMWKPIMQKHHYWGFTEIHYCYKEQFNNIRKTIPDHNDKLDDFVHFKCDEKFQWLITRDNPTEKVYLYKDKLNLEFSMKFYKGLIKNCEKNKQTIEIKNEI